MIIAHHDDVKDEKSSKKRGAACFDPSISSL